MLDGMHNFLFFYLCFYSIILPLLPSPAGLQGFATAPGVPPVTT